MHDNDVWNADAGWKAMERTWLAVGSYYWETDAFCTEDREPISKKLLERAIDKLEWIDATVERSLPAMPGLAIKEVIKEFRIPRVTQISYSSLKLAPYGLYGIEGIYKNGRVRIYLVDSGTHCTPVCADHWPDNGEALAAVRVTL